MPLSSPNHNSSNNSNNGNFSNNNNNDQYNDQYNDHDNNTKRASPKRGFMMRASSSNELHNDASSNFHNFRNNSDYDSGSSNNNNNYNQQQQQQQQQYQQTTSDFQSASQSSINANSNASENAIPTPAAPIICQPLTNSSNQGYNRDHGHGITTTISNETKYVKAQPPSDVIHIEDVEWAEENNTGVKYPFEMAVRPKQYKKEDPCGCTPRYNETTDTFDTTPCCTDSSCILFACQMECRSNCEAGDLCGNKRITKKMWKKVEVINAGVKGLGLRAMEDLKKGDFIIEYTGIAIKKEYLDNMFRRYKMERMLYIMALDNDVYIDARKKGSVARYINHSCDPNCAVHRWKVRGISRAGIFAQRDIKKGEELSFDYKWKRKRGRAPTKCHCMSQNCRGTLEDMFCKSEEEENEEKQLEEHWKEPLRLKGSGHEIMNRTIKIFSPEENQYFIADVCKYDEKDKKHCLIYRGESDETWEDLDTKQWMILDEQMEKFVIGRKMKNPIVHDSSDSRSTSPHPGSAKAGPIKKTKNYVIVQTPTKEKIASKFLVDRCQRHYRVQISVNCVYESSATDEAEALEEANALDASLDGHAWKYTITGMQPNDAREYLEQSIADFEKQSKDDAGIANSNNSKLYRHEIVIPRCVMDHVKRRMPILRNNCKNAEVTFAASGSKSKQFAKVIIEGSDQYHAGQAQIMLWKEVLTLCNAHGAPKTPAGLFKDLAFYGGELSHEEFNLLCPQLSSANINYDCCENLRETADMAAFEDFFRCTVWVQAIDDMGRINKRNQLDMGKSATRKIFFGCEPARIPELWNHIKSRIAEVSRGVNFYIVNDKHSLLFMTKNLEKIPNGMPSSLFDYLHQVTGASVQMDKFCSSSIRIDGNSSHNGTNFSSESTSSVSSPESSNSSLAEEIIRLQEEILKDSKIRQQRWGFGRDWSLMLNEEVVLESESGQANNNSGNPRQLNGKSLDKRYVVNICMEISQMTETLGLDSGVAAHACVILYRYLNQIFDATLNSSQVKQRDLSLACLFLANKCQKAFKWKRLEAVLEGAYKVYYPGARFDYKGEEAISWEKRILSTENNIVTKLDYDIFWAGADWITECVTASGDMKESTARTVMELALSGPSLAAGPILWLKLGPKYAFAAMTAIYSMDVEHLFESLSIKPLKLINAVELMTDSILSNRKIKHSGTQLLEVFQKNRESFSAINNLVKTVCEKKLSTQYQEKSIFLGNSKRYQIVARRSGRRRIFYGIDHAFFKDNILNKLQKIREQSHCNIYVEEGSNFQTENVILEGTWRGLAIAEHLFREIAPDRLHHAEDANNAASYKKEASTLMYRDYPGIIQMASVSAVDGWDDISECGWKSKIGGKTCIPGKVQSAAFLKAGMRWWLRPEYVPSLNGSLCNMLAIRRTFQGDLSGHMKELSKIAKSISIDNEGEGPQFPQLCAIEGATTQNTKEQSYVPVSLHRWPPEKTETKERSKGGMGVGASPSALQEMQLLNKLHSLIPGPHGHPNFVLPLAIALEDNNNVNKDEEPTNDTKVKAVPDLLTGRSDDLLAFLRPSDDLNYSKSKRPKMSGAHLLFQPTPIILQRVMSKGKKRKNDRPEAGFIPPTILTAWFHDLLSAIAHCHTNHVVLRTLHPDQILIDNSGVAKMSGLTRSIVLHPNDRERYLDPLSSTKIKGKKSAGVTEEDISSNPYMAPELLLGANRYTQQSDVWTLACLVAHLMIGKPIFSGRDRKSKMRAIFKIVGSSSSNNYKEAQQYPYYDMCKTDKKYKSGVDKALRYMFKDSEANADSYSCILQLLEKMLVLDPSKRITASDALMHLSMTDFIAQTTSDELRQQFVKDWMAMKATLSSDDDGNEEASSKSSRIKREFSQTLQNHTTDTKDDDDLYNMNDLEWKRPKLSD